MPRFIYLRLSGNLRMEGAYHMKMVRTGTVGHWEVYEKAGLSDARWGIVVFDEVKVEMEVGE